MTGNIQSANHARDSLVFFYTISAASILLLTGLAKFISAFGNQELLSLEDPIFGITFRRIMLLSGALELVIACICLMFGGQRISLWLVAWLATILFLYRVGLWYVGWSESCPCMGGFTDAIHLSRNSANILVKTFLIYLLSGSCVFLIREYCPRFSPSRKIE